MQIKSTVLAAISSYFLKNLNGQVRELYNQTNFPNNCILTWVQLFWGGKQAMSALLAAVMIYLLIFFCTSCELTFFDWSQ